MLANFMVRRTQAFLATATVLAAMVFTFVNSVSAGIDDSVAYNPPEFYDRIRAKRKSILAEQRQNIDLANHPRYRTTVTDDGGVLRIDRPTYWFEVNRGNGVVDRAGLLDVVATKGCALGDLEITDADGVTYNQYRAEGTITVTEEPTHLYWTTDFSPRCRQGDVLGLKIEARYHLRKLSGLTTVRYRIVEGSAEVTRVVIRNSLGKLPVNLHIAHSAFYKDNDDTFVDTLTESVRDDKNRVIASGKIAAPFWTDGRIGFHATALLKTWTQMGPFDEDQAERRSVIQTVDRHRHLDFFFVNTAAPTTIEAGREFESGFALLPFQRYEPKLPLVGSVNLPAQYDYLRSGSDEDLAKIVRDFRHTYWTGTAIGSTALANAGWTPLMYAVTREPFYERTQTVRDLGRECDLVLMTASCYVNNFPGIPGLGPHAGAEVNAHEPKLLEVMNKMAKEHGKEGYICSLSTPEVRDFWLDVRTSMLDVRTSMLEALDVDGDYEDLHAHIDVGSNFDSQVEGELTYIEDVFLLYNGYARERDRIFVAHAGNILTVADSLNGATWPGEPWSGQNFDEMPAAVLDILLNPFLIGTDVCFYANNAIYDIRSVKLCKQMIRNSVTPSYNAVAKEYAGTVTRPLTPKSEAAERAWQRYFVPSRTFGIVDSSYVSWRDPTAGGFFKVEDKEHKVNLYHRSDEAYVTCVQLGDDTIKPRLSFNVSGMGFKGPEAFVFDLLKRKLTVVPVTKGWIQYSVEEATNEPVLLYLKQKPNDVPAVIWSDFQVRFDNTTIEEEPDTDGFVGSATWNFKISV